MKIKVYPVKDSVEGSVTAPPSKSYTHRAVFASLLACGDSRIASPLIAGDTKATIDAVTRMGASVSVVNGELWIKGSCGRPTPPSWVYCAGSGTTLRIATAVAGLFDEPTLLYGDETLRRRPMKPLLIALASLGVESVSRHGYPPLAVKGPMGSGAVKVEAGASSQYVTALLMVSPLVGLEVETLGRVPSKPYIDITIRVLEAFGARVKRNGYESFHVDPTGLKSAHYRVPGDYSSAAYMLALGALTGRVRVYGLDPWDPQGDKTIIRILRDMGATVRIGEDYVESESAGRLQAVEVDLEDSPDLAPVVAALASHADGITVIKGVGHLAYKESNRLESITGALRSIGVDARHDGASIIVKGGGVKGGRASSSSDHRIAMMLAIAAVKAEAPVEIEGAERIGDSYPSFTADLSRLNVRVEVVHA